MTAIVRSYLTGAFHAALYVLLTLGFGAWLWGYV